MTTACAPSRPLTERPQDRLEELKKTVSASRLNCFHSCRLKFYFRYVLELMKPTTAALFTGKAVHMALQHWSKAGWRGAPIDPALLKSLFMENWKESQLSDPVDWQEEEDNERNKAWGLVEMYLRETPISPDEKPEGVEVIVEADLPMGTKLVGVIDLVRPGGRVVDFKTTSSTPQADLALHRNQTQLTAYGILHREATGKSVEGFELHHLIKTKTPKLVVVSTEGMDEAWEERFLGLVDSYKNGIDLEDWVPSPGLQCASCEFFHECARGRQQQDKRATA